MEATTNKPKQYIENVCMRAAENGVILSYDLYEDSMHDEFSGKKYIDNKQLIFKWSEWGAAGEQFMTLAKEAGGKTDNTSIQKK